MRNLARRTGRSGRTEKPARAARIPAAALLVAGGAQAGCGLSFCPRPEAPGAQSFELGLTAKETGFDIQETSGSYTELMGSLQYTAWGRLALGLHAPFILLHADDVSEAGPGNLIAYAELRVRPAWLAAFSAGVQLEIPSGASHHGLADDHFMAVPYVSLARHAGPVMLGAALGAAFALHGDHGGGHDHAAMGAAPVYVHPHEDMEFLYRVTAGTRLLEGRFLPEIFLDGQRVLGHTEEPDAGTDFLSVGASFPVIWNDLTVSPSLSFPVLPDHRFEWSAGATLGWRIGIGGEKGAYGET